MGKPINSNIITTGYHINEEAVRVMKKVGITSAQITLDGMKETHNTVKHLRLERMYSKESYPILNY